VSSGSEDLVGGEAGESVAGRLEVVVLATVAGRGLAGRVVGVAVDLDHASLCAPEEVDLVAAEPGVHLGFGKPCAADERQEALLELAAGDRRGAVLGCDQPAERSGPAPVGPLEGILDGAFRKQPADVGLLKSSFEEAIGNDGIEVHEGASDAGDWDAALCGQVRWVQATAAVKVDARPLGASCARWCRHVDVRLRRGQQLPVPGGGPVTQDRAVAASENGGNEAALARELSVTERVDAAPEPLQLPGLHPLQNLMAAEAARAKLLVGDDPKLPGRHRRGCAIQRRRPKRCRSFC